MAESSPSKRFMVRFADGTEIGPLEKKAVRLLAKSGRLRPDDSISLEGADKWVAAGMVPGFFPPPANSPSDDFIPLEQPLDFRSTESLAELGTETNEGVTRNRSPAVAIVEPSQEVGVSKRLIWAGVSLATVLVVTTLVWFVVSMRRSDERSKASDQLLAAIEQAEALPDSADNGEVSRQVEAVFRIADSKRKLIHPDILARSESLRPRLVAARLKGVETDIQRASQRAKQAIAAVSVDSMRSLANDAESIVKSVNERLRSLPPESLGDSSDKLSAVVADIESATKRADELEATLKQQEATRRQEDEMTAKGLVKLNGEWVSKDEFAKRTAKGKLRVTATYFYNEFKGNVPNEAAVFAIPKDKGLQGKKIPGNQIAMMTWRSSGTASTFMESIGGGFAWAGGDGKAELRLVPGEYTLLVLMDIRPYLASDGKELSQWFELPFAKSHGVLGRYDTMPVTVYPNDTTETSINLKY